MFKDKYNKDNEIIKPDEEKIKELKKNIMKGNHNHSKARHYLALVAVLILIPISVLILNEMKILDIGEILVSSQDDKVENIKDYDEVYNLLAKINEDDKYERRNYTEEVTEEINALKSDATQGIQQDKNMSNNYTDTNVQVQGVQEADIIKTDGEYIYYLNDNNIIITKADKKNTKVVGKISSEDIKSGYIREMYIAKDKLIVIRNEFEVNKYRENNMISEDYIDYIGNSIKTYVDIYDVSNKAKPKKINSLGQSGSYISSRMINDKVYVSTSEGVRFNNINKDKVDSYIPKTYINDDEEVLSEKDIYISKNPQDSSYLIVTSIDLQNCDKHLSIKGILGCGNNMYVNESNMYIAGNNVVSENRSSYDVTDIIKFSLNDGLVEYEGSTSVVGSLLNQFSMDEYNGYFRIVTTANKYVESDLFNDSKSSNNLYVLDSKLNVVGDINNVAKGERVYSVRFDGDIAYFVTFRQVDPLFSVDVSNPREPKILDELKISGFSEYMQPFKDNLLLGLGQEANEANGKVTGLKLSMFDVKDKTNIVEKDKKVLNEYAFSSEFYNHKTITVIKDKGIISFPVEQGEYLIFKYSNLNGFELIRQLQLDGYDLRGTYINDYLYLCSTEGIKVYDEKFNEVAFIEKL